MSKRVPSRYTPPAVPWKLVGNSLKSIEKHSRARRILLGAVWLVPLELKDQQSIFKRVFEADMRLREAGQEMEREGKRQKRGGDRRAEGEGKVKPKDWFDAPSLPEIQKMIDVLPWKASRGALIAAFDSVVATQPLGTRARQNAYDWKSRWRKFPMYKEWESIVWEDQLAVLKYLFEWVDGDEEERKKLSKWDFARQREQSPYTPINRRSVSPPQSSMYVFKAGPDHVRSDSVLQPRRSPPQVLFDAKYGLHPQEERGIASSHEVFHHDSPHWSFDFFDSNYLPEVNPHSPL
ncbi:uncharacterized protein JCM6883_000841 [Sporobolomyces salmoneus]|uniref:uncharacterized protein n=1 Tax=Sporobolomyces salmoneus TaxID=183962 RepID=UPI00317A926B